MAKIKNLILLCLSLLAIVGVMGSIITIGSKSLLPLIIGFISSGFLYLMAAANGAILDD